MAYKKGGSGDSMAASGMAFLEDNFEGAGNRVDAKWVLTRAIDRIHAICAYGQSERQGILQELPRRISLGATMLEALCSPIVDETYREEMRLFWERFDVTREENEKRGLAWDAELSVGLFKFGVLVRLIDRHNLMYERYMKDYVVPPERAKKEEALLSILRKTDAIEAELEKAMDEAKIAEAQAIEAQKATTAPEAPAPVIEAQAPIENPIEKPNEEKEKMTITTMYARSGLL